MRVRGLLPGRRRRCARPPTAPRPSPPDLVKAGVGIVYGGGDVGLMGVVADAALAAGGEVIGVIPRAPVRRRDRRTTA